ncbi:hypothetical protein MNBD_GAMMA15-1622 [hydrothermal vent metagenome]|uniref:Uncharacterized protein n=1 Tax=hydrothermal vent metagenome TaxID=652676 RepID=A0A3B0Z724_9ZZZZ
MSARKDIIDGKFKNNTAAKAALRAAGGNGPLAVLFGNFVGYANVNWKYSAQSGAQTAKNLLDGTGKKNVACGTLREAFKIMIREDLKLVAKNADVNGYFLTKPDLKCFDPSVKGNVGNQGKQTFDLACHFSAHYFVQVAGKFYDPCLMAVYTSLEGPIAHRTSMIKGTYPYVRMAGDGKALVLLQHLPGKAVSGFQSVWRILLPKDLKKKGAELVSKDNLKLIKKNQRVKNSRLL